MPLLPLPRAGQEDNSRGMPSQALPQDNPNIVLPNAPHQDKTPFYTMFSPLFERFGTSADIKKDR